MSASPPGNIRITDTRRRRRILSPRLRNSSDASTVYPRALTQTASYNNLNQLTNLSGQALTFDADGNLLSDGQRNYTWDAENRLVGIAYPGQAGKATTFSYDGLEPAHRDHLLRPRAAAARSPRPTSGAARVSARRAMQAVRRRASIMPKASSFPARRRSLIITAPIRSARCGASSPARAARRPSATMLMATRYKATAPLTDFNYAGMFYNADSGLYLTQYRGLRSGLGTMAVSRSDRRGNK